LALHQICSIDTGCSDPQANLTGSRFRIWKRTPFERGKTRLRVWWTIAHHPAVRH
jgi:hypothetical protein